MESPKPPPKRRYQMTERASNAEATRARILEAAGALYMRGASAGDFTLEEVAAGAGVAARTILRAFGSREHLLHAALVRLAENGVPLKPTAPGDTAAMINAMFDLYEAMGDLVMRQLAEEQRFPAMKPLLDHGRRNHRDAVRQAFAPQLAACPAAERERLLNALVTTTDVYVWAKLRRDIGLSRAEAENTVRLMVEAVLAREVGDGEPVVAELVGRRKSSA
jgi:AcrR family transcriptional regulator